MFLVIKLFIITKHIEQLNRHIIIILTERGQILKVCSDKVQESNLPAAVFLRSVLILHNQPDVLSVQVSAGANGSTDRVCRVCQCALA